MKNNKSIAVAAIVRNNSRNQFLLIREDVGEQGYWYLPNNLLRPGKNIADMAVQTVLEQTDVCCRMTAELTCFYDALNNLEWRFVALEHIYGKPTPKQPGIAEAKWCTPQEIAVLVYQNLPREVLEFINKLP